jgi:hypothetical protein
VLEVHLLEEFLLEGLGEGLDVHVVAVASALAAAVDVLLALGVEEVGDWGEDRADLLAVPEPAVDVLERVFGVVLVAVLDVDVAHDVVAQVVHHDHVLDLAVLAHLLEDLLEELLELVERLLSVLGSDDVARNDGGLDGVVLVHVLEEDGLADGRLVVDAFAAVAVAAGADLVEEGTVHLVHLRPIDFRQPLSHTIKL